MFARVCTYHSSVGDNMWLRWSEWQQRTSHNPWFWFTTATCLFSDKHLVYNVFHQVLLWEVHSFTLSDHTQSQALHLRVACYLEVLSSKFSSSLSKDSISIFCRRVSLLLIKCRQIKTPRKLAFFKITRCEVVLTSSSAGDVNSEEAKLMHPANRDTPRERSR